MWLYSQEIRFYENVFLNWHVGYQWRKFYSQKSTFHFRTGHTPTAYQNYKVNTKKNYPFNFPFYVIFCLTTQWKLQKHTLFGYGYILFTWRYSFLEYFRYFQIETVKLKKKTIIKIIQSNEILGLKRKIYILSKKKLM